MKVGREGGSDGERREEEEKKQGMREKGRE